MTAQVDEYRTEQPSVSLFFSLSFVSFPFCFGFLLADFEEKGKGNPTMTGSVGLGQGKMAM